MRSSKLPFALSVTLFLAACGGDDSIRTSAEDTGVGSDVGEDTTSNDDTSNDATGTDDVASDTTIVPDATELAVPEFGTDETRSFDVIASNADGLREPRDLAFDPESPGNLWIASRQTDGIAIVFDAGTEAQSTELFLDTFRNHFMDAVSSLAFGQPGTFGTCQESRNTYNGQGPENEFMGPALWPSDLDVFAAVNQNAFGELGGSHLDMLHQSPNCMGIEHVSGNGYFVVDGYNGHLVYYDFQEDHGPGADDHSDGIVHRYPEVALTRVAGVPSHMVLDRSSNLLYIADTGGGRVITFTVGSGTRGRDLFATNEPLEDFAEFLDAEQAVFASGMAGPSGLALSNGRLFVGEFETGEIVAFDVATGEELGRLDTGAYDLMGLEIGPDGNLWFTDGGANEVIRIRP